MDYRVKIEYINLMTEAVIIIKIRSKTIATYIKSFLQYSRLSTQICQKKTDGKMIESKIGSVPTTPIISIRFKMMFA